MKRGFLNNQPPVQFGPEALDGELCGIGDFWFVEQVSGGLTVLLAELADGGSTGQCVDGLVVIDRQGGIQVGKIVVDVPRHLPVDVIKGERFAAEQTVAEFHQTALRAVRSDAIR